MLTTSDTSTEKNSRVATIHLKNAFHFEDDVLVEFLSGSCLFCLSTANGCSDCCDLDDITDVFSFPAETESEAFDTQELKKKV